MNIFSQIFKSAQEKVNFDVQSIYQGHHHITYRGTKTIKCPFDYVIYQMIITELKPDLIIEIGTNCGGSALYLADLMNVIEHGIIHTIDINPAIEPLLKHSRIKFFTNGWQDYNLNNAQEFSKILIIDDASHLYEETLETLNKFAPLVTKNSYFIVEDGIIDELGMSKNYRGGPLKAIQKFLDTNKNFVVDRKWCDMFGQNATFNVNGYLKKIN